MDMKTKNEMINKEILFELFKTISRTMDYVSVKNNDSKLVSAITKGPGSKIEENTQLTLDVISSIISKQIRNKFSL